MQYIEILYDPYTPVSYIASNMENVYGNESAVKFIYFDIVFEFIAAPDIPTILFVDGASIRLPPLR